MKIAVGHRHRICQISVYLRTVLVYTCMHVQFSSHTCRETEGHDKACGERVRQASVGDAAGSSRRSVGSNGAEEPSQKRGLVSKIPFVTASRLVTNS